MEQIVASDPRVFAPTPKWRSLPTRVLRYATVPVAASALVIGAGTAASALGYENPIGDWWFRDRLVTAQSVDVDGIECRFGLAVVPAIVETWTEGGSWSIDPETGAVTVNGEIVDLDILGATEILNGIDIAAITAGFPDASLLGEVTRYDAEPGEEVLFSLPSKGGDDISAWIEIPDYSEGQLITITAPQDQETNDAFLAAIDAEFRSQLIARGIDPAPLALERNQTCDLDMVVSFD